MSFEPKETVGARRTSNMYPYERGTLLRVSTKNDGIIEGLILQNPSKTATPTTLELSRCYLVDKEGDRVEPIGTYRLTTDEIISTKVIRLPDEIKQTPAGKLLQERLHQTLVINTVKLLDKLIENLKMYDVVGLNFYGIYIGRDGKAGWICLSLPGVLVNIDVLALEKSKTFWKKLDEALFSNKAIKKVMYNSRPIVDYIYHHFSFAMKNVFDIQVADFIIRSADKGHQYVRQSRDRIEYSSLDVILQEYLKSDLVAEEIQLLQWIDRQDFSKKCPLMDRPLSNPRLCKCVALQMKHLLPLKKAMEERMMLQFTNCMGANMESMSLGNNYEMEFQLSKPLMVPAKVVDAYYNFYKTGGPADGQNKKVASCRPITMENGTTQATVTNPVTNGLPFNGIMGRGRGRGRGDQKTFFGYKPLGHHPIVVAGRGRGIMESD